MPLLRSPKIEFDQLKMYFGEPYVIDLEDAYGSITVYMPTIGDIIRIGEKRFYSNLNIFICTTTQYRLPLWEMGIDWNEKSNFELFVMLYKTADPECTKLLFGDLDFSKFEPLLKQKPPKAKVEGENSDDDDDDNSDDENVEEKPELVLWDDEDQIEINENVYNHFSQYIASVFAIALEEKITTDNTLKQWYINKDRRLVENKKKNEEKGKEEKTISIQALISSLVNHPGFKYKLQELREVGICEFYDSVKRLQIYEQSTALMKGMYSGFIDGSKIKPENYNFMRDIDK